MMLAIKLGVSLMLAGATATAAEDTKYKRLRFDKRAESTSESSIDNGADIVTKCEPCFVVEGFPLETN